MEHTMFEPGRYLKRALQIVWNYKVLWIFGFLIALTGGAANGGSSGGGGSRYRENMQSNYNEFRDLGNVGNYSPQMQQVTDWFLENVEPLFATEAKAITTVLIIMGILFGIALIFGLLGALVRYPSETAVMRLVDAHEQNGTKLNFKEGWKLGWNHRAWRIFLVDLVIGTPAFGVVVLLMGGLGVYFFANRQNIEGAFNTGVGIWIGLVVLLMMALVFVLIVISMVRPYIIRKIAFEDLGVWEGFRQGWGLFKQNLKHTLLMWLILIGVSIAFGIAVMLVAILLIPAYIVLAIPGLIAAAVPAAIGFAITSLFTGQVLSWIVAGLLAIPVLLVVMFSPLTLISGAYTVFNSNVWTLLYRDKNLPLVPPEIPAVAEDGK
jgi:hypothetical protein